MRVIYDPAVLKHTARGELKHGRIIPARERPERAQMIVERLQSIEGFDFSMPPNLDMDLIRIVHDADYVAFLQSVWTDWRNTVGGDDGDTPDALPLTFMARSFPNQPPSAIAAKLGYYGFDAGTPITEHTWTSASAAAASAIEAARLIAGGTERLVFALTRPPGHHAAHDQFGGYCFLNNAALAAQTALNASAERVAILDVDYHHGNGSQSIFYERADVLVVNIHADPSFEYPFFLGHADETGRGAGEGANVNLPLPAGTEWPHYRRALDSALAAITKFSPDVLILSWGFDTFIEDPLSTFKLYTDDFSRLGEAIGGLRVPTLIVLEGGYAVDALGANVLNGLSALANGAG